MTIQDNETCEKCNGWAVGGGVSKDRIICMDCLLKEQKEIVKKLGENEINHVKGFSILTKSQRQYYVMYNYMTVISLSS